MDKTTQKPALNPADMLVSAVGGTLDLVSIDGEVLMEIHVPPGTHRASTFLNLVSSGQALEIADGLVAVPPRSLCAVTSYPEAINRQSDANPDWRPTGASAMEKRLQALLYRRREESTRTERRAAAQASLEAARKRAEDEAVQKVADEKAAADAKEAAAQSERDKLAAAIAKAQAVVE